MTEHFGWKLVILAIMAEAVFRTAKGWKGTFSRIRLKCIELCLYLPLENNVNSLQQFSRKLLYRVDTIYKIYVWNIVIYLITRSHSLSLYERSNFLQLVICQLSLCMCVFSLLYKTRSNLLWLHQLLRLHEFQYWRTQRVWSKIIRAEFGIRLN